MSHFRPFRKIRNEAEKVTMRISGFGIEYTLSSTVLFLFGNSNTTF